MQRSVLSTSLETSWSLLRNTFLVFKVRAANLEKTPGDQILGRNP